MLESDARSKKIAVVAHCLLNQNAKVQGLAVYQGVFEPIASILFRKGIGIIQMPCPELKILGPARPLGTDTVDQYDTDEFRAKCIDLTSEILLEISAYHNSGYRIMCILGVDGSPSCSVVQVPKLTKSGQRILESGKGIFMQILNDELEKKGFVFPMIGVPENRKSLYFDDALTKIISILE
ncbi:MAG: hypothetical protein A2161_20080 [Candidatus Schekmanbacteria bacterium RBG_13_48_7]|uniref:Uncharacterized protein n=1 Tax=Candidatus Schekmanbacteria bacterium RBG_13_48_7 TaxID=1817878 RepID=A0A1F7RZQ5_9BACT|nr:MAG: hypothetical protein A2161_20080 [Candidatus Schekmanbacteria bacterium RBG_13_48_7]